jgi:hypothetical protein
MNVLVINSGSSSVKYQLIDTEASLALAMGKIERLSGAETYRLAFGDVEKAVSGHRIDAVGHRVVHGGALFSMPHLIDDGVFAAIESCIPLAPLHNPANLAGIKAAREILPAVPHVGVFDTAFHSRMPRRALTYAIDPGIAEPMKIRRYGFHGISHAYVAQKAAEYLECGLHRLRLVSCHHGKGPHASRGRTQQGCQQVLAPAAAPQALLPYSPSEHIEVFDHQHHHEDEAGDHQGMGKDFHESLAHDVKPRFRKKPCFIPTVSGTRISSASTEDNLSLWLILLPFTIAGKIPNGISVISSRRFDPRQYGYSDIPGVPKLKFLTFYHRVVLLPQSSGPSLATARRASVLTEERGVFQQSELRAQT